MKTYNNDIFEQLYTSLKMLEKESKLKDELIDTLTEHNRLLEARIEELFSIVHQISDSE